MNEIKLEIKKTLLEILQLKISIEELRDDMSFFGTEEHPGLIEDSLVVLEIASVLAEKYDISPTMFNEESFQNINSLSFMIYTEMNKSN